MYVCAAEAVDRLFFVADEEEAAGFWRESTPVGLAGIFPGEVEEHFGLDGVGVLKFVYEEAAVAILEVLPNPGVFAEEGSGFEEEVLEGKVSVGVAPGFVEGDGVFYQGCNGGVNVLPPAG